MYKLRITVDNVDVSDCKAFEEHGGEYYQGYWEHNEICHEYENHCSDNPNCFYKKQMRITRFT